MASYTHRIRIYNGCFCIFLVICVFQTYQPIQAQNPNLCVAASPCVVKTGTSPQVNILTVTQVADDKCCDYDKRTPL